MAYVAKQQMQEAIADFNFCLQINPKAELGIP
jgi:hypothetical protein